MRGIFHPRPLNGCAWTVSGVPTSTPYVLHCLVCRASESSARASKSHRRWLCGAAICDPHHYDLLLQSCSGDLDALKRIHSSLTTSGLIRGRPRLSSRVIFNYSGLGMLDDARSLFDALDCRDPFVWNTLIRGYANAGSSQEALQLYALMHKSAVPSDNFTFPFALKACATASQLLEGKLIHGQIIRTGFGSDAFVEAGLVDMYAKCGDVRAARKVFDKMVRRDLVSWTAMITGYEQSECADDSLEMFLKMQKESFVPDCVTLVTVASAVAQLGALKEAKSIHAYVIRNGFEKDLSVDNSLVSMYTRCGEVGLARRVFDRMSDRDRISWNSMLSGYSQNGHTTDTLLLFDQMKLSGVKPNSVTVLIVVSACACVGSLQVGKAIHRFIIDNRIEFDNTLRNAIVDMYAKCGDLDTAVQLFETMHERNTSSWNVMICSYGIHGYGKDAVALFYRMQDEGFEPNHVTFTCLLSACSRAGLVDEGRECFYLMRRTGVTPTVKHYACMVDMLGRAGFLDEARNLIAEMPSQPNDSVWGALLGACRIHRNLGLGEYAANNLFHLEPDHAGYYVLMSNVYAASGKWKEVGKLREIMRFKGLKKPAACSMIEFDGEVHAFYSSDRSCPDLGPLYRQAETLVMEIRGLGYLPDRSCVLHDVEDEDKEHILSFHSEKLALAFGLMHTSSGTPIQVTNNLRVCCDCHTVFKFISNMYRRKITLRDSNRFHHFEKGVCSCRDYW
ncbi:Pentatricopeptide repeat-containing protein [Nymphaea thermarum]|nr:Pentatricopeptide repeat-containing protein [Nymphaea thermarum]